MGRTNAQPDAPLGYVVINERFGATIYKFISATAYIIVVEDLGKGKESQKPIGKPDLMYQSGSLADCIAYVRQGNPKKTA